MTFKIDAKIETRKFKNGSFEVLVLKLSNHTEKIVFLTSAEMEILSNTYKNDYSLDMPDLR